MDGNREQGPNDPSKDSWGQGESIGPFQSCLHHYGGLHSTIYKSREDDGTLVAIKVTIPHLLAEPHDVKREVRLLQASASAHVVPLLQTLKLDGGRLVLVFPFFQYDFEQLLRRDMVTGTQTKSILRDMFRALAHLHAQGILHRDIKPSNILVDSPEGPAYLADFGIAWKEGTEGSEPADQKITDVGTTCYRAPEILFGYRGYGSALDLWAAGCVVAEAVAVGHQQLFDSGPLGSDLSLIQSIFKTLGTPDAESWPVSSVLLYFFFLFISFYFFSPFFLSNPSSVVLSNVDVMRRKRNYSPIGTRSISINILPKSGMPPFRGHLPRAATW